MEIILASQSPRRRELLERMGIKNFRIVTPDIDEHMERELPPEELVRRISAEKARAVREQAGMDAVVIAADTVVALDGAVLGKPADELEAFKMLSTSPAAATRSIPALPSCGGRSGTPSARRPPSPSGS